MDGRVALYDLLVSPEGPVTTFDIAGVAEPIHDVRFSPGLATRWLAVANLSAVSLYRVPWKLINGKLSAERHMHDLLQDSDDFCGVKYTSQDKRKCGSSQMNALRDQA
jgi:hypothetical protein